MALLPEPFVSVALAKKTDLKVVLDMQTLWKEISGSDQLPQSGIVVKGEFADAYPDYVAAFLKQFEASVNYVNTNTNKLATLAETHGLTIPAPAIKTGIPRSNIRYESAKEAKDAIINYFNILLENSPSDIGGKLPDDKFIG